MVQAHFMLDTQGYKYTHRLCNIHCPSIATVVARTRLNVTSHAHCLSSCFQKRGALQPTLYRSASLSLFRCVVSNHVAHIPVYVSETIYGLKECQDKDPLPLQNSQTCHIVTIYMFKFDCFNSMLDLRIRSVFNKKVYFLQLQTLFLNVLQLHEAHKVRSITLVALSKSPVIIYHLPSASIARF